jgi:puromycin-sensitive aminopeptidase
LLSSHPIQVPIRHAEEVEQVFDAISYCKGGSVVRMIKAVLGMTHFQQGLSNYMKKYAYGNTETLDLWQSWEDVSGMPIAELMASWTEQMGFPLLKIVKEDWHDDHVVLELEQSWFLADGSEPPEAKLWGTSRSACVSHGSGNDESRTLTLPYTHFRFPFALPCCGCCRHRGALSLFFASVISYTDPHRHTVRDTTRYDLDA